MPLEKGMRDGKKKELETSGKGWTGTWRINGDFSLR